MFWHPFELQVLVHGRPVYEYHRDGKVFIEGRRGSEYTLCIRNSRRDRVLAVVSVDGLSVMTGQVASRHGSGYIINGHNYVDIPGWRINDAQVARFFFGELPAAYATQMGKPENVGVIGVAIFEEEDPYEDEDPLASVGDLGGCPGDSFLGGDDSRRKSRGIGTGFGRRTPHGVTYQDFRRRPNPTRELIIRYDDAEGLRRRGIIVASAHDPGDRVVAARPFPRDIGCQPPPGWRG